MSTPTCAFLPAGCASEGDGAPSRPMVSVTARRSGKVVIASRRRSGISEHSLTLDRRKGSILRDTRVHFPLDRFWPRDRVVVEDAIARPAQRAAPPRAFASGGRRTENHLWVGLLRSSSLPGGAKIGW